MTDTDTPTPTPELNTPTPTPQDPPAPAAVASPNTPAEAPKYVPVDRFDAVTAQKWDLTRKLQSTEQELQLAKDTLAELQRMQNASGQTPPAQPNAPALGEAEINRRATQMAAEHIFNDRCNDAVREGRKSHSDFQDSIDALVKIAPTVDARGQPMLPPAFVEAALDTGRGSEVLYALGRDPGEADRIMSLPPTRQAIELARFADRLSIAPAQGVPSGGISNAPPPIRPVVGGGRTALRPEDLAMDDPSKPVDVWMRQRQAQVAERAKNGWRR